MTTTTPDKYTTIHNNTQFKLKLEQTQTRMNNHLQSPDKTTQSIHSTQKQTQTHTMHIHKHFKMHRMHNKNTKTHNAHRKYKTIHQSDSTHVT